MIDITVPLGPKTPHYPGDPAVEVRLVAEIGAESGYRLSALALSAHSGTHVDAPGHFLPGGKLVEDLPVDYFCGPALVIAGAGPVLSAPAVAAAGDVRGCFVLFRTANSAHWGEAAFYDNYVALDPSGARALIDAGARGVGVDYLSVERPDGGGAVHRLLLGAGLAIIEGLNLAAATPGFYRLICLPLRAEGLEGAPARAVLMKAEPQNR